MKKASMNLPNTLSLLRCALVPVFVVTLFLMRDISVWGRVIPAIVYLITGLTDMLDGKIARKYNLVTDFGKFIDLGVEGVKEQIKRSLENHCGDADKVDFLNASLMMCDGIIAWADKCSNECKMRALTETDKKRKAELFRMSENLKRVPRYPEEVLLQIPRLYFR